MDVYQRSYCRPIETLVDIFQEYPDEIEYIFKPSCVPLMRCGGCCNDEGLECVPTEEFNITMQVGTCGERGRGRVGGWGIRLCQQVVPGPLLGSSRREEPGLPCPPLAPESVKGRCGGLTLFGEKDARISEPRFPASPDHLLLLPDLCPLSSGGG